MRGRGAVAALSIGLLASACAGLIYKADTSGSESILGNPSIVVKMDSEFYPVYGRTIDDLNTSLSRTRPSAGAQAIAIGEHMGGFIAQFRPRMVDGKCVPGVTVGVTSTIMLPQWVDSAKGDLEVQSSWRSFVKVIRTHEATHRGILFHYAAEFEHVANASYSGPCSAPDATFATYRQEGALERAAQQEFDIKSRGTLRLRPTSTTRRPPPAPA